jgi:acyl carrier protein
MTEPLSAAPTQKCVRDVIFDQMRTIAQEQKKVLAKLTDQLMLLESGLDSLCVAILVANLEDEFGVDPFGTGDDTQMPVTVGELVRIYENALHA